MSLYNLPDSPVLWTSFYVDGRRYRRSTGHTNRAKALRREAELILEVENGDTALAKKVRPLIREQVTLFLQYVDATRLADKTKEYYHNGCRMLLIAGIGGYRFDSLNSAQIETLAIPGAGATVNCALRSLRRMYNHAAATGAILKARIPTITLLPENERERVVRVDEEAHILDNVHQTLGDVYVLMMDCGARPGECVTLRWDEHVDFITGVVLVGDKGKTGKKGRRKVAMTARMREVLLRRAVGNQVWVFASNRKIGHHITSHAISSRMSEFKRLNGLPKDLVLYSARHTFATDYQAEQGDITKTQRQLGHTRITTTTRYVHPELQGDAAMMDARNAKRTSNRSQVFGQGVVPVQ
jgi:site-specific recombinase XerC